MIYGKLLEANSIKPLIEIQINDDIDELVVEAALKDTIEEKFNELKNKENPTKADVDKIVRSIELIQDEKSRRKGYAVFIHLAISILGYGAACSIGTIPAYMISILLSLLSIFVSNSFSSFNQGGSIKEIYESIDKVKDKYNKRIDDINISLKEDPNNKDFKEDLRNSKKIIDLCNKTMQAVKSNKGKMTQQIAGSLFRNKKND